MVRNLLMAMDARRSVGASPGLSEPALQRTFRVRDPPLDIDLQLSLVGRHPERASGSASPSFFAAVLRGDAMGEATAARWLGRDGRRRIVRSLGAGALALGLFAGCGGAGSAGGATENRSAPAPVAKPKEPEAVEIKSDPLNTGVASGDAALTAKVKARLAADPDVSAAHVDVDAQGGRVTLWGEVGRPEVKAKAESLAKGTPGVSSVADLVKVAAER